LVVIKKKTTLLNSAYLLFIQAISMLSFVLNSSILKTYKRKDDNSILFFSCC